MVASSVVFVGRFKLFADLIKGSGSRFGFEVSGSRRFSNQRKWDLNLNFEISPLSKIGIGT
jgi:hypothetical protein